MKSKLVILSLLLSGATIANAPPAKVLKALKLEGQFLYQCRRGWTSCDQPQQL